jgi:uncharacterized membrane protein YeaQ/YmgE (transglycosylase-associated protein family)
VPIFLLAAIVVLAIVIFIWAAGSLIHLALMLLVAGIVGWAADAIVPGRLPWGWLGAIFAGLLGGWLGSLVLGPVGPELFGVRIVPAFVGAVVLAFLADLVGKRSLPARMR